MVRPTYVEVDLGAIAWNVRAFKRLVTPSRLCSIVKADAYGHGDVPVANAALDAGADMLGVALVEEGARLREAGIAAPILLLSEPPPQDAVDLAKWQLTPTAYSMSFIEALATTGSRHDIHLKVDTGMHRVGAPPDRIGDLVSTVQRARNLNLAALWTHFAVADEDPQFTRIQMERFDEVVTGLDVEFSHLANTAAAVLFPETRRSMCRVGLGTYGLHPCPETVGEIELRPAMRLITHVSHVRHLEAGERPSYGRIRALDKPANVLTAPIGYADGFTRALTREGSVLVGGKRYPLAGMVTMDQIMIDVADEVFDVGDEVVLLGGQGEERINAEDWAEALGTISYEVVCSIGARVPRRYLDS